MAKVVPGRMTARMDGDFVVFLIGMRINKPWKLHKWIPVTRAMGPMLTELSKRKELGLMSFNVWVGPTGPLVVQYWKSVEQLEAFAKDPALTHRPAWKAFNKAVGNGGDVGVWHETYAVTNGAYEAVYANMPAFGLATAGAHMPVGAATHEAAARRATNAATAA
jgi:Domain of unknown function (DUF4188)